nr:MAG TPA: hypothetical protein [Caudoviricetes sp.]
MILYYNHDAEIKSLQGDDCNEQSSIMAII